MQALAGFIMRGRSQAALVAAGTAVLSLLVPLAALLSSAAVALFTLRQGGREGGLVALFAALASGLIVFAALGSPWPAIGFAAALWFPVWGLGLVLRQSRSLNLTVQLAAVFGLLVVLAVRLQTPDPAAYWSELLEPVRAGLVEGGVVDAEASRALVQQIAPWMTGAFAATFYFQILLALFIGRWWQAVLYNPGGFGAEFRELRLHPAAGVLGVLAFVVLNVQDHAIWAAELLLLLTPLYLLQGVAVTHALAVAFRAKRVWLVGFYALLVLAMPHAELLVAGLGLADIWVNVRAKIHALVDRDSEGR
jgi:hypothetical protein